MPLDAYRNYTRAAFFKDAIAACIVTSLLIPQALAYAMLAGLPPEVGLYSSIAPLIFYALLGSSRTMSVGPVAVISLMTAVALGTAIEGGQFSHLEASFALTLLTGFFLLLLGVIKFGFISNFLSHSVISGFVTASCILIVVSQMKHLLGIETTNAIDVSGVTLLYELVISVNRTDLLTLVVGGFSLAILLINKYYGVVMMRGFKLSPYRVSLLHKAAPLLLIITLVLLSDFVNLEAKGLAITGFVPSALPSLVVASPEARLIGDLWVPALTIAIIVFVESVAVAKALAAKKKERVAPNRELLGLGVANIGSAISGGMPVAGGFSRSAVNFDAGAATKLSGVIAAIFMVASCVFIAPFFEALPKAVLAATIVVSVLSLIDLELISRTWSYSKSDFVAVFLTIVITLLFGVEVGVLCGVSASLVLTLYRSAKPHVAEVGLVPGTQHFRNVDRFEVEIDPSILLLRQDESLFFANAEQLQDRVLDALYKRDEIAHVILQFSAINEVDFSALEMLETLNDRLYEQGVILHLSEVKGPVYDKLKLAGFIHCLHGKIFLSQYEAFSELRARVS